MDDAVNDVFLYHKLSGKNYLSIYNILIHIVHSSELFLSVPLVNMTSGQVQVDHPYCNFITDLSAVRPILHERSKDSKLKMLFRVFSTYTAVSMFDMAYFVPNKEPCRCGFCQRVVQCLDPKKYIEEEDKKNRAKKREKLKISKTTRTNKKAKKNDDVISHSSVILDRLFPTESICVLSPEFVIPEPEREIDYTSKPPPPPPSYGTSTEEKFDDVLDRLYETQSATKEFYFPPMPPNPFDAFSDMANVFCDDQNDYNGDWNDVIAYDDDISLAAPCSLSDLTYAA